MTFLNIHSNYLLENWSGVEYYYLPLKVVQGNSIEVIPNRTVTKIKMNKNKKNYTFFYVSGNDGITFKIAVMIGKDERWNISKVRNNTTLEWEGYDHPLITDILSTFYKGTVVRIVTDAIDIPDGNYILTANPMRKQTHKKHTIWELEFTTYEGFTTSVFANDNSVVKNAINQAKKKQSASNSSKKVSAKTSSSKSKSTDKTKLSKCSLSNLKYSKSKKVVTCVKYLQNVLKKHKMYSGKSDGWYGSLTKSAVKKFQNKYKKKYKLTANGKVDKKTLNALVKV